MAEAPEYLAILRAALAGSLPRCIDERSAAFSCAMLDELCRAGYMTATRFQAIKEGLRLIDPKITLAGREYLQRLEQEAVPNQATEPPAGIPDPVKKPYQVTLHGIAAGVIVAVLAAAVLYLLRHHLGIPL